MDNLAQTFGNDDDDHDIPNSLRGAVVHRISLASVLLRLARMITNQKAGRS